MSKGKTEKTWKPANEKQYIETIEALGHETGMLEHEIWVLKDESRDREDALAEYKNVTRQKQEALDCGAELIKSLDQKNSLLIQENSRLATLLRNKQGVINELIEQLGRVDVLLTVIGRELAND